MILEILTAGGLATGVAIGVNRLREIHERKRRRTQLRSLAVEHGMKLLGSEEHDYLEVEELDETGQDVACVLVGIMEGRDEAGPFALGYRFASGVGQHFLQFETSSDELPEGLHVQPESGRVREEWWQRILRRARREVRKTRGARLQIQWTTDPETLRSERRLVTATRWISEIARGAAASSAMRVGLTVQRGRVTLYSTSALSDPSLASFYERSMRLRRLMTQGVGAAPARRTVRTATSTGEVRAQERRHQAATRPVQPVEAEARASSNTKIIDISAEELIRDHPVEKKRAFEVPEPEEEVRVISSR